jgi:hypothetical protein
VITRRPLDNLGDDKGRDPPGPADRQGLRALYLQQYTYIDLVAYEGQNHPEQH